MTPIELGNERFLRLAAFLEALPPGRFNFQSWVGPDWKRMRDLPCGTTACAFGWATVALPECGLELRNGGAWGNPLVCLTSLPANEDSDYHDSVLAGMAVFAITELEFDLLFLPEDQWPNDDYEDLESSTDTRRPLPEDSTAAEVAANLRAFVAARRGG